MTPPPTADDGRTVDETPVTIGDQVPAFELPGVSDDGIQQFSLEELAADGPVVLSFYPFDFSPVCTSHLCGFRDAEWLTVTENVDVVGISVDSAYSHKKFREEYNLSFPLLTDRLASVAAEFGVRYDEWENHPAVCQRSLFAVDSSLTVQYAWHTADAEEQPTLDNLADAVGWI